MFTMYIDDCKYQQNGVRRRRVLLRQAHYNKGKITRETIANISHLSDEEIEAIKIALKHKKNLTYLENLAKGDAVCGKIVGPVAALDHVAQKLGIKRALGTSIKGRLSMWLVLARLLDQGSRLSAVRLAQTHAGCELLNIQSLNEDVLYDTLDWMFENKVSIQKSLFRTWQKKKANKSSHIFLYDASSSYFEGLQNELAEYGYDRDGKRGKKVVLYGLLTDEEGDPLAIEVFKGNTKDNKTVNTQINLLKKQFGCKYITLVGDKGMLKSAQIEELTGEDFNYITSITKAQIETLFDCGILQLSLFDKNVCEVYDEEKDNRYVYRRNPFRAEEIRNNRQSKLRAIEQKTLQSNQYLSEHPRAHVKTQKKDIKSYIAKLKMGSIARVIKVRNQRKIQLKVDGAALLEAERLDGCYVIKTNLPKSILSKEVIHARYKDLAFVEWAFRISKSELDARPINVRKKNRTYAHFLTVMLAYKIERELRCSWSKINLTVSEGIKMLCKIGSTIITIGETEIVRVPKPDPICRNLLKKIDCTLPATMKKSTVRITTRKKLQSSR